MRAAFLAGVIALVACAPASAARLTQLPGRAGCLADDGEHNCSRVSSTATGTAGVTDLVVSPDGRNLYATDGDLLVFKRDRRSGRLTQLRATAGRGLGASHLAISADGRTLYATVASDEDPFGTRKADAGVVVFRRAPATGSVRRVECWTQLGARGCRSALLSGGSVALAPDGKQLLVGYGFLSVLPVAPDGRLGPPTACHPTARRDPPGCSDPKLPQALDIEALAITPDGRRVFSIGGRDDVGQLVALTRDPATGAISPGSCAGDAPEGAPPCAAARSLDGPQDVAVAPDGRAVYVAASYDQRPEGGALIFYTSAIAAFTVDPFAQLHGPAGCSLFSGRRDPGCGRAPQFRGLGAVAITPNGKHALAATNFSGAVVLLRRNRANHALARVPGRGGCLADRSGSVLYPARRGCGSTHGMAYPAAIAFSPDSRNAYVASEFGLAVLALR